MKPKVSVFIATSIDGFIARRDGRLDWLDAANERVPSGEDCGYGDFISTVDCLVMGRHTFEQVLTFGDWPYAQVPVTVMTSRALDIPDRLPENVTQSSEDPAALCERLGSAGFQHVYVDGGITIQRFLKANLVDELTITVIPVLLGDGIPLFGDLSADVALTPANVIQFDCGFVQLTYVIDR